VKRWRWSIIGLALAVLFVPVLVRQLLPVEFRQLERVALPDTRHIEISFQNRTQNLALGGLLFVPAGDGPFPAAVVIHGSGTSRRDNGWYLTPTKHLQNSGIVVLLPDKRGSEESEGNWRTSSFEDLATDTHAAIGHLREQQSVPISGIGVIGMSQGGWIAPLVASQEDDLAFLVSLVGSVVTPREQLLYEENYNLRQVGFLPGISNVLAYVGSANVRTIREFARRSMRVPDTRWRVLTDRATASFGKTHSKRLRSLSVTWV